MKNKFYRIGLYLVLVSLLVSCGSREVNNQPPQIFIADLQTQQNQLQIQLQVRNINHDAMPGAQIKFTFMIANTNAYHGEQQLNLSLDGKGTEQVRWKSVANPKVLQLLQRLSGGSLKNLEYRLSGTLTNELSKKKFKFSQNGKVYAVPGKPGHYRLAGISGNTRLNHQQTDRAKGH